MNLKSIASQYIYKNYRSKRRIKSIAVAGNLTYHSVTNRINTKKYQ